MSSLVIGTVAVGAVAIGGCQRSAPPAVAAESSDSVDAAALAGTWFIVASDQPTWTSGDRAFPSIHYAPSQREDGRVTLEDRVTFIADGKPSELRGSDTQEEAGALAFTWRGTGALSLVSTRWRVVHMAPDKSWAITFYDKTIATPAGVAILSRSSNLPAAALDEARGVLVESGALREHADGLREVAQAGPTTSAGGS